MRIKKCITCGYDLDSVDHLMTCISPDKTWSSGRGKRTGEWD